MIDPTLVTSAVVGVITAAVLGTIQIINTRSTAAITLQREVALTAERAKDREEAAAIRAADRADASEDRKAMLLKAAQAVSLSEANGKKVDEVITGVAKVHELTNSTNSDLQKALALMTEKFAGAERMIAMLMQQIKDTAASQATSDLQVSAAMHTTPLVATIGPARPAGALDRVGDKP